MKKSSRALSFILCLIMIMGMLPTQAFATELDPAIVGEPSPEPILEATQEPILEPGLEPASEEPPVEPTTESTVEPAAEPTAEPSEEPTVEPTTEPAPTPEYVSVSFNCTPVELSLSVYVTYEETVAAQPDGSYFLAPGYYAYSAACEGYIGVELVPFEVVSGSGSISIDVTLEAIPPEPELPAPVRVEFNCTPAETLVWVADEFDNEYEPEADGSFLLMPGSYYYVAFCEGYVGVDKELIIEDGSNPVVIDVVMEEDENPEVEATYGVTNRDDGIWLFPLPSWSYNSFSDWCGCPGYDAVCSVCGGNCGSKWGDGWHSNQGGHNGFDIAAGEGTTVYAASKGVIVAAEYSNARGNTLVIEHKIGDTGYSYYSYYQHLSSFAKTSGTVESGDLVAYTGSTGVGSGAHFHFGIVRGTSGRTGLGSCLDSLEYLGWVLREGQQEGRILNNPALDSLCGFPTGIYVDGLRAHAGSTKYTFDKSQTTCWPEIGVKPKPPTAPALTNLQCNYPTDSSGRATVTFTWNEASGADRYFLEICNLREDGTYRSYFESGLGYEGTQSSALSLSEGWYYVRLIANNGAGSTNGNKQFFSVGHGSTSPVSSTKYNGHTYERYDCHMSWTEAKAFCESLGGYLAVPSSQAEQTAINSLMTGTTNGLYFLGLSDIKQDGTWETVTGEPVSYTNWSSGEPSYSANEYYVHMYARYEDETIVSEGKWNDVANKNSDIGSFWNYGNIGFICEYDNKHEHSWSGTVTKNATCTADGVKTFSCSGCSETYTEKLPALGHDYKTTTISGSCTQRPGTKYTCSRCSDTYTDWDEGGWSEWSTTYPSGVDSEHIETATQYRYRNKETTTSNSQTLVGWTYSGSEQVWSDYGAWSNWSTNSVTASDSTQVEKAPLYRYYYFLCDTCGDHNPFSGRCGCGGTSNYWVETRSTIAYPQSNSSVVSYASSKRQTWSIGDGQQWYFSSGNLNATAIGTIDADGTAEVISQGYRYRTRSQSTVYNFYRWGEWSAWSGTAVSASASKEVEKRTVYRYDLYASGKHSWNNGSVTQNPSCTVEGVKTYTCTSCGDTKTEAIAAKGHTEVVDKAVAATCTAAGKTEGKHCSVCSAIIKAQTTIAAKGHDFGEWTQTKAPTLTEDGEESRSCRNNGCSEVESRVIKATVYTVSYDANGGSGAPADQKKLKGTAITLSSITPSRDGHTFIGWALSSTATTIDYAPGASYADDTDAVLYAVWEKEEATASGSCGSSLAWSYDEATGTLTISGNGAMYDYIDSPVPWADYYTTNIVIEPGVTALGINAISYLNSTMTIKSGTSLDMYSPIVLPDGSKLILEDGSSLNLKSKTYDVIIGDNGQSINMNWSGGLQFMGGMMETRGSASLSWEEYSLPFGYYPDKYITFSDATNYDIPTDRISYVYEVTTAQQLYAALETNHSHASINIAGAITVDRNITVPYNYNLSVNGFLGESVLTVPSPYVLTNNGFLHTNGNGKFVLGKEIETGETGMVPPNTVIEYSYVAKVGETGYMTLNEALVAAVSGGTVQLQKDAEDTYIMVTPGITLDLNGHALTASYLVGFNGTNVVDSSAENTGLLKVPSFNNVVLAAGNSQLPIWTGEGYMFVDIIGFTEWNLKTADGRPQYLFEPAFETIAHQYVSKGAESSKVKVAVTLSWDEATATAYQDYVYTDTTVYNVINSYNGSYYNRVFGVIINNTEHGTERSAVLISDTGVKMHFPKN